LAYGFRYDRLDWDTFGYADASYSVRQPDSVCHPNYLAIFSGDYIFNTRKLVMNAISVFEFQPSFDLRVILINNEPWFVAVDVCAALDISNVTMALRRLDEDEQALSSIEGRTPTGGTTEQQVNIINESGLYSLILGSRKTEAKKFKKWVTSEVLPSIRKTGQYTAPVKVDKRDYLTQSDMMNIKRLIYSCASHIWYKAAFSSAIWFRLRQITGVPSPARFEVQHLPAIAQEFHRILTMVEPYLEATRKAELSLIKDCIRNDNPTMLAGFLEQMNKTVSDDQHRLSVHLGRAFNDECLALINRKPNQYDHDDYNEA
jgi:prophage antirepressor-like protein